MNKPLTIKIPIALAESVIWQRKLVCQYETNKVIRAIDTWLCLKSLTTTGVIQFYCNQKNELLQLCKISKASLYTRLHYLQNEKLITWNKRSGTIKLCSYEKLADHYNYTHTSFININYDITDNRKICQFLFSIEIESNQKRQTEALYNSINKNPETKNTLITLMQQYGADRTRLSEPEYFRKTLWLMQRESFKRGTSGTDIYEVLHSFRADNNRSVHKGLKHAWNCKSPSTVSDIKRGLVKAFIITVEHVKITSRVRSRKKKDEGFVLWLDYKKQTKWFCCDQVKTIPSTEPVLVKISTAA